MRLSTKNALRKKLSNLVRITRGCREDMHEPDEQDVTAKVKGKIFDNAGVPGELVLVISKGGYKEEINLATLVALARKANLSD